MDWFYYKSGRYFSIGEQEKAAHELQIPVSHWCGSHPLARTCHNEREITSLIGTVPDEDTVWCYNILSLGTSLSVIMRSLKKYHASGPCLRIHTIGYCDTPDRSDYEMMYTTLKELSKRAARGGHKSPGRPDRNIHINTISDRGRDAVYRYLAGEINRQACRKVVERSAPDGRTIGKDLFARLIREAKSKNITIDDRNPVCKPRPEPARPGNNTACGA